MTEISIPVAERRRVEVEALLPVLLLGVWLCLLGPWWSVYQFDTDEGINLMKAALVAAGYGLYHEIWSDQPPVLTFILAAAQLAFPYKVAAARIVVLAFACLLAWSLFRIVRRTEGRVAAWTAVGAMYGSAGFLSLSVSVMTGLPAIALALAALDQAMPGASDRGRRRFLFAGILFGLSLQTKMFTLLMLPSLVCAIFLIPEGATRIAFWRSRSLDTGLALAGAGTTFFILATATGEPMLDQLITPHLAPSVVAYQEPHGWRTLGSLMAREKILVVSAIVGLVAILIGRRRLLYVVPIVWCGVALLVFGFHRPLWHHHLLMALVPMAWLGGIAVRVGLDWLATIRARTWMRYSYLLVICTMLVVAAVWAAPRFGTTTATVNPLDHAVAAALRTHPQSDPWVLTDQPIDAYRAGLLVPPELAVYSYKRFSRGYLPAQLIISVISSRRPIVVMNRRLPIDPEVRKFLAASSYIRISDQEAPPYYLRSDLIRSKSDPLNRSFGHTLRNQ
jgi:4-amino-4-deoxy-L-arabinose transferase-like glycosyltransferase